MNTRSHLEPGPRASRDFQAPMPGTRVAMRESMMKGITMVLSPDKIPYKGGETRNFYRENVVAFGKIRYYGSFLTSYLVRLLDGTEVMVKTSEQNDDDARWLRKFAKGLHPGSASRDIGFSVIWREVLSWY